MPANELTQAMTDEQRFLFDLNGFIVVRSALTAEEVARYRDGIYRLARQDLPAERWTSDGEPLDQIRVQAINRDPMFLELVDHPVSLPLVQEIVGEPGILIDNDVELTPRNNKVQGWHRGIGTYGYALDAAGFHCTMVKCIWYLTDCGPGDGPTRIVPGSHKSLIEPPSYSEQAGPPGTQEVIVEAGDLLVFSEACLHAGNLNQSGRVRANMYFNYGPSWVQPWEGYRPAAELVERATGDRRQLLGGGRIWEG
ncbi:ectoine hydroxylase-related dioxygenase (phytanoyl-CoA dioxygenase family) [Microlunatus panaciterrae]|uniref:Ectoine hydroxylase-related dioxygenase (Phytanoyl-CoA dioxygenase family) n=2 Tax=Microlunatus panaciterrae TaxID=400768 RepID=A0ABS2RPE7_9ACTN|nr:phytanoyl-CoA dioxygenase family protein [Microlunatus panaciterrae]MBM7800538.1 ectoine hydroxylase-related dioxygenase (phytanoyl-CoA dioxygenase family) [Microlunatus panaciterrae]